MPSSSEMCEWLYDLSSLSQDLSLGFQAELQLHAVLYSEIIVFISFSLPRDLLLYVNSIWFGKSLFFSVSFL